MKLRFLLTVMTAVLLGVSRGAEPPKLFWYEVVVEVGNTVERFVGASEIEVGEFEQRLSNQGFVTLENLRALENRGDGARWWAVREGEQVTIRSSRVLYFYVLKKDPKG